MVIGLVVDKQSTAFMDWMKEEEEEEDGYLRDLVFSVKFGVLTRDRFRCFGEYIYTLSCQAFYWKINTLT